MKRSRSIWMTDTLYQQLLLIAKQEGRSFSNLIEVILVSYVNNRLSSMADKDDIS